jgi:hypothetical protein
VLLSRAVLRSLNRSQLQTDSEKVTRETAAYDRLDAVLRVTKPLCQKTTSDDDDDDDDEQDDRQGRESAVAIVSIG